jgi:hypothetical protein
MKTKLEPNVNIVRLLLKPARKLLADPIRAINAARNDETFRNLCSKEYCSLFPNTILSILLKTLCNILLLFEHLIYCTNVINQNFKA